MIAVRLVLALALILATSAIAAVDRGPIRIGMLVPQTGPLAANGKEMENGFRLYLEEQGQRIGGREIKLFVEDTEAKPATALTKARALIESQSVHLLVGPLSTAEATRSPSVTALATASGRGPLLPMHVVHPYPTR